MTALIECVPHLILLKEDIWRDDDPERREAAQIVTEHFLLRKHFRRTLYLKIKHDKIEPVHFDLSKIENQIIWITNNWDAVAGHFPARIRLMDGTIDYQACEGLAADFMSAFLAIEPKYRLFKTLNGHHANVFGAIASGVVKAAGASPDVAASCEQFKKLLSDRPDIGLSWSDLSIERFILGKHKRYSWESLPAIAHIATRWTLLEQEKYETSCLSYNVPRFSFSADIFAEKSSSATNDSEQQQYIDSAVAKILKDARNNLSDLGIKLLVAIFSDQETSGPLVKKAPLTELDAASQYWLADISTIFNFSKITRNFGVSRTIAEKLVTELQNWCQALHLPDANLTEIMRAVKYEIKSGALFEPTN